MRPAHLSILLFELYFARGKSVSYSISIATNFS